MPPWIIAAIPVAIGALVSVCTAALFIGPFVIPLWAQTMEEKKRVKFVAAVKGALDNVESFVISTPTDLDNLLLKVGRMLERELGKVKGKDAEKLESIKTSMVAKAVKSANAPSGAPVGVSIPGVGVRGLGL